MKKIVVSVMISVILLSQLAGCATFNSKEMIDMIDNGQTITIEVAQPDYQISVLGSPEDTTEWTQLDQLKTYNDLRLNFDTIFNINTITSNGINGKSGCLFVNESGETDGNTTLEDAFRNKQFVEKYWSDSSIRSQVSKLASLAYTDVDTTKSDSLYASINAYYDLLNDNIDPNSFNATQSLTREQFYAFVFKACEGVQDLTSDSDYTEATGGTTDYSLYAQQVQDFAFLNTDDDCLDSSNVGGSISRAEAVYMIVNKYFPDELSAVVGKEDCYEDCKNAGDLALKAGFKEKKDGVVTAKKNWQTFALAYMMQHPDKGMQEELYKAMVVAYNEGLLGENETESRWDEPIDKSEAMQLMINVYLALDKSEGYITSVEYGQIDETTIDTTTVTQADITEGNIVANAGEGADTQLTDEQKESVYIGDSSGDVDTTGTASAPPVATTTAPAGAGDMVFGSDSDTIERGHPVTDEEAQAADDIMDQYGPINVQ